MKILWLSHLVPYPPKGGVLQRSYNMLMETCIRHQVDLLAFNQKGLMSPIFESVEHGLAEAEGVLQNKCDNIKILPTPIDRVSYGKQITALKSLFTQPYNVIWLRCPEYRDIMGRWLEESNYDLALFDTISLAPYLDLIPSGTKTILDHHNIESHMLFRRADNEGNLFKKYYFRHEASRLEKYEKEICPKFDLNITCSTIDTERLKLLSPTLRVETVPNGVDTDYFDRTTTHKSQSEARLIFVGTLNWYPNISAVLFIANKLWPKLRSRFPNLEFDIVGANPPKVIQELASRDDSFHVHGFVPDVRPYMESATIYVCPIDDGGGTKLKILDAMAMGMPIVAYPIACEGIDVINNENILLAENESGFIEQITKLLESSSLRSIIGVNARKLMVEKYCYNKIGEEFSHLLINCSEQS